MAKIHLLDSSVAELIAAGEVVERPSSIVKELLENSVDAGSRNITVEIKDGGISYIRVTDDGSGILKEDIKNAFVRHATSKICTAEDLNQIYTFGFRGEALASIAAMCKVEVLSRTAGEVSGTRYVVEGMQEKAFEEAACHVGTTIIVKDIFFNTPARMKFLKKDSTEGSGVSQIVEKIALANPHISFKLIKDRKVAVITPGNGDYLAAVHTVCGADFAKNLIPADYTNAGIRVHGFVTHPQNSRATRAMQTFFVNNRYVRTKSAANALEEAYKSLIMGGKFPGCVLFLDIPAQTVDVNVHPAKIEVRFSNEHLVYETVYVAVKTALDAFFEKTTRQRSFTPFELSEKTYTTNEQTRITAEEYRKSFSFNQPPAKSRGNSAFGHSTNPAAGLKEEPNVDNTTNLNTFSFYEKQTPPELQAAAAVADLTAKPNESTGVLRDSGSYAWPTNKNMGTATLHSLKKPDEAEPQQPNATELPHKPPAKLIGEVFATYYLAEQDGVMFIIDKHAAHERYIYNKLIKQYTQNSAERQLLISPEIVTLPKDEYNAILEGGEKLLGMGFLVDDFGEGSVAVREVPVNISEADIGGLVAEIAQMLIKNRQTLVLEEFTALLSSVACRSAIKAGSRESNAEMQELINLVLVDPGLRFCPHGRPIVIEYTKYQIEKMFGRQL